MDKNEKTLKHRICIRMIICMGILHSSERALSEIYSKNKSSIMNYV